MNDKLTHRENIQAAGTTEAKTQCPPQYEVFFLNDDYTPMDFVVKILKYLFQFDHQRAVRLMLSIHQQGTGVVGVFSREIAETKVVEANRYSRACKHLLLCAMRKV